MKIEEKKVVSINYTLKSVDGELLDEAEEGNPFYFIQGRGTLIPGLEKALEGRVEGDTFQVTIPPEEAYGEIDENLVQQVPKDQFEFEDKQEIEVGNFFEVETEHGIIVVTVVDINGEMVTIDGNHPLCGETLHFDVKVVGVRDALQQELESGDIHFDDDE